jgi:hypothetical protein
MNEKLKYKIRTVVEKLGLKQSLEIFGKDILKQVYMDNPSLFLNQFNNLKLVDKEDYIYYVDNDNHPLFFYSKKESEIKNDWYNIHSKRIWWFFQTILGYSYTETREIIKKWLKSTYNLGELEPIQASWVERSVI